MFQPTFQIFDPEFADLIGKFPKLQTVVSCDYAEGPVYLLDENGERGYFFFSDSFNGEIWVVIHLPPTTFTLPIVWRTGVDLPNGQTADLDGRLVTCSGREVSRVSAAGEMEVLVDSYQDVPLNSPNDVVVKSDGSIWFTDPTYGCLFEVQECTLPTRVYRLDPETGALQVVTAQPVMPNGLAFSPDESRLYVCDSAAVQAASTQYNYLPHEILVFEVNADGTGVEPGGTVFAEVSPGIPDGTRVDQQGRVYAAARDGVHVFNPEGDLIGKIITSSSPANLTFGGPDNDILFIAAGTIYALPLFGTQGAVPVRTLGFDLQLPPFFKNSRGQPVHST